MTPSFGRGAATAFQGAAGWVPSWGFGGWCLNLAMARFGFRFLGSLGEAWCVVLCGLVVALWLGADLLYMVFRRTLM